MRKIVTLITLLVSAQAFAGEKTCIKAVDHANTKIELCYDSYEFESSGSVSIGKIIPIELLENSNLIGYFPAKLASVDRLNSQNCNTLDIHTSYTLKVEGLNQKYQFGKLRRPFCKSGFSTSVFLFPTADNINNKPTAPFNFDCKTEDSHKISIQIFRNGEARITEGYDDSNHFFQGLRGHWKEDRNGAFNINARGLPMKDPWNEASASASLEISPLGSFASGTFESGTQNTGFEKVAVECLVNKN